MSDSVKDRFLADSKRYTDKAHEDIKMYLVALEEQYKTLNYPEVLSSLASAHEDLGLLAYFVRNDTAAFKRHWYLTSKLLVMAAKHIPADDEFNSAGVSMDTNLLYALVSDSQAVIDEFAHLETNRLSIHRDNPKATEFTLQLAQLILRGDYELAQAKIEIGAKKGGGKLKQAYATRTDFYSLLIKGDKTALEASIMDNTRFRKTGMPYICDFLYPGATFKAKLCWHKGIPVEIDHPMVPMDWMPIAPLARYDDIYDFFLPDWMPPDQSLFARISRKFQKDYPVVNACMERIYKIDQR